MYKVEAIGENRDLSLNENYCHRLLCNFISPAFFAYGKMDNFEGASNIMRTILCTPLNTTMSLWLSYVMRLHCKINVIWCIVLLSVCSFSSAFMVPVVLVSKTLLLLLVSTAWVDAGCFGPEALVPIGTVIRCPCFLQDTDVTQDCVVSEHDASTGSGEVRCLVQPTCYEDCPGIQ